MFLKQHPPRGSKMNGRSTLQQGYTQFFKAQSRDTISDALCHLVIACSLTHLSNILSPGMEAA